MLIIGCRGDEYSWDLGSDSGFLSGDADLLEDWSKRYGRAVVAGDEEALSTLGREIFAWLDEGGAGSRWVTAPGDLVLEIRADPSSDESRRVDALLDVPFEVLAGDRGFFAVEDDRLFSVARRVTIDGPVREPEHADLSLMFMAAAPEGQQTLSYEAEEAAIIEATRSKQTGRPLAHVVVEESGCIENLGERLALDGPFEIGHLSCHGEIDDGGPFLAMETDVGELDKVTPGRLIQELGGQKPLFMFVSACRTAELGGDGRPSAGGEGYREGLAEDKVPWPERGGPAGSAVPELAQPYVRRLAGQIANVVGWDGSVRDHEATTFAATFYQALAKRETVPIAAAQARRTLYRSRFENPQQGRHWHLARVYLGPGGGGPLSANGKPDRPPAGRDAEQAFLDAKRHRVPVATRAEFVGRRRQIQEVFRAWRSGKPGVLVHGMGNLGKSSLAARIASRLNGHETVVIHGRYDAQSIFEQIEEALPAEARLAMAEELPTWKEMVKGLATSLAVVLEAMLEGALDKDPILLIVDDLEQALVDPSEGEGAITVRPAYAEALGSVLRAFAKAKTRSHLLLTSRYRFTLPDGSGGDLADKLASVQLRPMAEPARARQWQAAARSKGRTGETEAARVPSDLLQTVLAASAGNPGLQEILSRPLLAGEFELSRKAADAVQHYRSTGEHPPEDNAAHEFFQRVSFETYAAALTPGQKDVLTATSFFSEDVPVPVTALLAAAKEMTAVDPGPALDRLLVLGLVDSWGEIDSHDHAAINPLARPLAGNLELAWSEDMAKAAMPCLVTAWRRSDGSFPLNAFSVEAARFAVLAKADAEIVNATAVAASSYHFRQMHDARSALAVTRSALDCLAKCGAAPAPWLLLLGVDCAERLGEMDLLDGLLEMASSLREQETSEAGGLFLCRGRVQARRGDIEQALADNKAAASIFEALGQDRERAIALGQIADILMQHGKVDEALKIRREDQLSVFERLGDIRERAITMGEIADILMQQGKVDEALKIRREDELPVYERLGDMRSKAITMGKIADILLRQDKVDEALKIRREDELPVYERLGDIRSKAVTMGEIADILMQQGKVDEALKIRREDELPVYEHLGDIRLKGVTLQQIATATIEVEGLTKENIEHVFNALSEAFAIALQIKDPDGIVSLAIQLCQILGIAGHYDLLADVLDRAEAVLNEIDHQPGIDAIKSFRTQFGPDDN